MKRCLLVFTGLLVLSAGLWSQETAASGFSDRNRLIINVAGYAEDANCHMGLLPGIMRASLDAQANFAIIDTAAYYAFDTGEGTPGFLALIEAAAKIPRNDPLLEQAIEVLLRCNLTLGLVRTIEDYGAGKLEPSEFSSYLDECLKSADYTTVKEAFEAKQF